MLLPSLILMYSQMGYLMSGWVGRKDLASSATAAGWAGWQDSTYNTHSTQERGRGMDTASSAWSVPCGDVWLGSVSESLQCLVRRVRGTVSFAVFAWSRGEIVTGFCPEGYLLPRVLDRENPPCFYLCVFSYSVKAKIYRRQTTPNQGTHCHIIHWVCRPLASQPFSSAFHTHLIVALSMYFA